MIACRFAGILVCFTLAFMSSGPAVSEESTAIFELEVDITWSADTTPLEFPSSAHLSRLIGAAHDAGYALFRDGHTASSGLELVAENGRDTILRAEFDEAMQRDRIGTVIDAPALAKVPGKISVTFETTKDHPILSFVMMVAPSPDWFTGVADIALMADGMWADELNLVLWPWDSGTDSGQTYLAANNDTQPQQSIRLLASPHFLGETGLTALGTAKLRRVLP